MPCLNEANAIASIQNKFAYKRQQRLFSVCSRQFKKKTKQQTKKNACLQLGDARLRVFFDACDWRERIEWLVVEERRTLAMLSGWRGAQLHEVATADYKAAAIFSRLKFEATQSNCNYTRDVCGVYDDKPRRAARKHQSRRL